MRPCLFLVCTIPAGKNLVNPNPNGASCGNATVFSTVVSGSAGDIKIQEMAGCATLNYPYPLATRMAEIREFDARSFSAMKC